MHSKPPEASPAPRSLLAQWLGVLAPPLLWLLQFEARYALAGNTRGSPAHVVMQVIAFVAFLLVGLCALVGLRQWRLAHASPLDRFAGVGGRTRFMGALGLLSSSLFLLVIAAQWLADLFIAPGKS